MAIVTIKNSLAKIFGNHLGSLKPGVNEMEEKVWLELAKTPVVKHHVAEGEIEVLELPRASPDSPVAIADLNVKEAVSLVKATFDKELLNRWAEAESRKQVLDALEKQFDAIDLKKKEQGEEEAEEEGSEEKEA